ncbi:hypothetical protein CPCC7001_774 [Cyanobium sp. PCC 7001]|nr:hypothetical protein CPCC7001_774 [Cyanobium sp. PCC 7001]
MTSTIAEQHWTDMLNTNPLPLGTSLQLASGSDRLASRIHGSLFVIPADHDLAGLSARLQ